MNGVTDPHSPSEEERKLYEQFITELEKRELASTDNFDKSILTLSSAGLGLSIGFLKDVGGQALLQPLALYFSWVMFLVATVSTMSSFHISSKAMKYHKDVAKRAYLERDDAAFEEANPWDLWTRRFNVISGLTFFGALVLTIYFVIINVEGRAMSGNQNKVPAKRVIDQQGYHVPVMRKPATPTTPASNSGKQEAPPPPPSTKG